MSADVPGERQQAKRFANAAVVKSVKLVRSVQNGSCEMDCVGNGYCFTAELGGALDVTVPQIVCHPSYFYFHADSFDAPHKTINQSLHPSRWLALQHLCNS